MHRYLLALVLISFHVGAAPSQGKKPRDPNVADTDPLPPAQEQKKFHLPPGFAMQLVAAEPDVKKPINIAFDAKGRLWVTGSEQYPFPAPPGGKPKDKLVILDDFGPDGRARKVTTFADDLNIPIGVLPMPDCKSALVFSIPNIWLLTDTDGDGKADKKEAMYTGFGFADTHGMTGEFVWGFDGWVYCCHGYANTSHVKAAKGDTSIKMHSGNTYRIKPDGSRIEQFTWGQVNPFGLAFDPLGNLYSTDCHTRPLYQLLKGAYYPSFGKPHDGLGFGPEMVTHDHGSTALCGIAYYAADQYPKEFHDNLFIGNVITNRINRDRIAWSGSTPRGVEMPDLVKCDDPWFRPVDIKLGPDGALYVADFYTRIIGHYEVPLNHPMRDFDKGRIWRIVYVGADGKGKPKEYRAMAERTEDDLVASLGDSNLAVRTFATNELAGRPELELEVRRSIGKGKEPLTGVRAAHVWWVLERIGRGGGITDLPEISNAAHNPNRLELVHVAKILGERKSLSDREREALRVLLKDADPFVQRAAAGALGAHPRIDHLVALGELCAKVAEEDAQLLHAARIALRNQVNDPKVAKAIPETRWKDGRAWNSVIDVCLGSPSPDAARYLALYGLITSDADLLRRRTHHIIRHGEPSLRARLMPLISEIHASNLYLTGAAVKGFVEGSQERAVQLTATERRWAEKIIERMLDVFHAGTLQDGIELASALKVADAQPALLGIVKNSEQPERQRKSAVAALVAIEPRKHVEPLARLLQDENEKIGVREQIASSLASVNQAEAHAALIHSFEKAPARLQTTIALGMASSNQGGNKLLEAVAAGKASARLLQDRAIEVKLRQARIGNLEQRLANLTRGLPPADQKAQELIARRKLGFAAAQTDVKQGKLLFEKHCAACHIVANQGSKIGPQLDGIGIRGVERLLEDIFDPSRNVDQAFRATTLELDNGQFVTGLLLREEGKVLVMADNQGKEVRIEGSKVANRTVGQLSPMPANLVEQIPEAEFHHLMAFLLEQRVK